MRRIAFALVLMIVSGWAAPSQAQWWGGGWGRPCFDGCRPWRGGGWAVPRRFVVIGDEPRPVWGGPGAFGPPWFRAGGRGWAMWRREMRWRRWADAGRDAAAPPEAERPRVERPARWRSPLPSDAVASLPRAHRAGAADAVRDERRGPDRAEAVVAMFPAVALRFARPKVHAAMPSRVLAAAAMLRRAPLPAVGPAPVVAAVVRPPEPPPRPAPTALRRAGSPFSPSADVRPAVLRNQPAAAPAPTPAAARPAPAAAAPAQAGPEPVEAAPADVPVAPLD